MMVFSFLHSAGQVSYGVSKVPPASIFGVNQLGLGTCWSNWEEEVSQMVWHKLHSLVSFLYFWPTKNLASFLHNRSTRSFQSLLE